METETNLRLKCDGSVYITSKKVITSVLFAWLGLILGISFIEAPLKFQAPGITFELGLGIGRLVFGALNKIEVLLTITIAIPSIYLFASNRLVSIFIFIIFTILAIQTFYLLPLLNIRAENILRHKFVVPSNHHFIYVGFEFLKVFLLITSGILLQKNNRYEKGY